MRKPRTRPPSGGPSITKAIRLGASEVKLFALAAAICGDESWASFVMRSARERAAAVVLESASLAEVGDIERRIAEEIAKSTVLRRRSMDIERKSMDEQGT